MTKNTSDIELIEKFLDGDLSEQEKADIENRLQSDSEFKELYTYRISIQEKWNEANEYEKTKLEIKQVIRNQKNQKRRMLVWYSVASIIILLLIVPAVLNRKSDTQLADSNESQLQIDEPGNKASQFYFDDQFKLLSPSDNQLLKSDKAIVFKWDSSLDVKTKLVIKEKNKDRVVYSISVKSSTKRYILKEKLESGEYIWELKGFEGKESFVKE